MTIKFVEKKQFVQTSQSLRKIHINQTEPHSLTNQGTVEREVREMKWDYLKFNVSIMLAPHLVIDSSCL